MPSTFLIYTDHFYFFYEEISIEVFYTFLKLNYLPAVVLKLQLLFYIFWILSHYSDTKFADTSSHSIGCLSADC